MLLSWIRSPYEGTDPFLFSFPAALSGTGRDLPCGTVQAICKYFVKSEEFFKNLLIFARTVAKIVLALRKKEC